MLLPRLLLFAAVSRLVPAERHITSRADAAATYGADAHHSCTIDDSSGVQQVTWQKVSADGAVQNLASYSKRFGEQVNWPYQAKVFFTKASLRSSSIVLKNVTWQDGGCYVCSFNTFPGGSKNQQNCLEVQGISEVKTSSPTSSPERQGTKEVVVSCSATGRPRPTIEWAVSDDRLPVRQNDPVVVTNGDGTFTSSVNVSLRARPGQSGHVDCLVNRGRAGERQDRVPFSLGQEAEPPESGTQHWNPAVAVPVVACLLVLVAAAVAAMAARKRLKGRRLAEVTQEFPTDVVY